MAREDEGQAARNQKSEIIGGELDCSLEDLCLACKVEADWVAALVEHGALDPQGPSKSEWRFASVSIVHVAKAKRLERDLGLNLPGVALALDLLEQIDTLRARLRAFEDSR